MATDNMLEITDEAGDYLVASEEPQEYVYLSIYGVNSGRVSGIELELENIEKLASYLNAIAQDIRTSREEE